MFPESPFLPPLPSKPFSQAPCPIEKLLTAQGPRKKSRNPSNNPRWGKFEVSHQKLSLEAVFLCPGSILKPAFLLE